jgi:hypothetical protein
MDNDDRPIGRVLNRREALTLLVALGPSPRCRYAPSLDR